MSKKRQTTIYDPRAREAYELTTLSYDYAPGYVIPEHTHDTDQLIYADNGVMTVHTNDGAWVVPANRAVWIPANMPHGLQMSGAVSMKTLYFKVGIVKSLPESCSVVHVSPLLKELIRHICKKPGLQERSKVDKNLLNVLLDQFEEIDNVPLQLPHLSDPRARDIANTLLAAPADQRSLAEICKAHGTHKRTIERLFQLETNMAFGKWRQQLRLLESLRLLAAGETVTKAALEAGYSNPSAFIHMFKKTLGSSPAKYFR